MFDILKGMDAAVLHSLPFADGQVIKEGEWVVVGVNGKVSKVTGQYAPATMGKTYQVYGGTDRLDSKELGRVTCALGHSYLGETDIFAAESIAAGDALTVKNGVLSKLATVDASTIEGTVVGYAITSNAAGRLRYTRV